MYTHAQARTQLLLGKPHGEGCAWASVTEILQPPRGKLRGRAEKVPGGALGKASPGGFWGERGREALLVPSGRVQASQRARPPPVRGLSTVLTVEAS